MQRQSETRKREIESEKQQRHRQQVGKTTVLRCQHYTQQRSGTIVPHSEREPKLPSKLRPAKLPLCCPTVHFNKKGVSQNDCCVSSKCSFIQSTMNDCVVFINNLLIEKTPDYVCYTRYFESINVCLLIPFRFRITFLAFTRFQRIWGSHG